MSIKRKIILTMSCFSIFILSILGINLYLAGHLSKNIKEMSFVTSKLKTYNQFSNDSTLTNLGYMDAIIDKVSGEVDQDIIEQHHKYFKDFENLKKADKSFEVYEEKLMALKSTAESMFESIKNHAPDKDYEKYDDVLDGTVDDVLAKNKLTVDVLEKEYKEISQKTLELNEFVESAQYVSFLLCIVISVIMVIYLTRSIVSSLSLTVTELKTSSRALKANSDELSQNSDNLSSASTQQASSLQETVTSMNEISAMVQRTAEASTQSAELAENSKLNSKLGQELMQTLELAISDISKSNNNISNEVSSNNEKFAEIVSLIKDIEARTSVINDIVFQTKLLSFNASVEAARAGEHGKGFAIVAEEVGNLASLSGKAADEISSMLDNSVSQVENIISSSKDRVEQLLRVGDEKTKIGQDKAYECGNALQAILNDSLNLSALNSEIESASKEQSLGIQEMLHALQELDHATHQNTNIAHASTDLAKKLNGQSQRIEGVVDSLEAFIGESKSNATVFQFQTKEDLPGHKKAA